MNSHEALHAIASLPGGRRVCLMHVCGHQERVITLSDMRRQLPDHVDIVSGPGCAASLAPPGELVQALRLAQCEGVTLLVQDNLMRVPLAPGAAGFLPGSLRAAAAEGLDIREISAPIEAVVAAQAEPGREMVMFVAGFETLLAPLAGMILEGLPANLSILLCGRRAVPLVDNALRDSPVRVDGLILPGNRCALTGIEAWEGVADRHRLPAAVAGYTPGAILSAIHAVLARVARGASGIDNCYRSLVRPGGYLESRARLAQVFAVVAGEWRGLGQVPDSAYRLRPAFADVDANRRYPDHRPPDLGADDALPADCHCDAVSLGHVLPVACRHFALRCTPMAPVGPCMASEDAACFIRRNRANVG